MQEEFDDDSYSLDDFASHALSSICEEVVSRKSSVIRDDGSYSVDDDFANTTNPKTATLKPTCKSSIKRGDDSYSVDNDFDSTSKCDTAPRKVAHMSSEQREDDSYSVDYDFDSTSKHEPTAWKVALSSPDSYYQRERPASPHESKEECDEFMREEEHVTLPIIYASKRNIHQEITEECKHGLETGQLDDHLDAVESESSMQTPVQWMTKDTDGDIDVAEIAHAKVMQFHPPFGDTNESPISEAAIPTESNDQSSCRWEEADKLPCQDAQTQTQPKGPIHHTQALPVKKPVSFVPRCAYANTKSMQLRNGGPQTEQEKPATNGRRYSKKRLEQLAKPAKHHLYEKENIEPEQTSNTCKPRKKYIDHGFDDSESFLNRMENMERQRQQKLVRRAAEAVYNARADKKVCKNCGTTQSFDEANEGRTECQNDVCRSRKFLYQPPTQFVLKQFEERMDRSAKRRSLVFERIEEERRSTIIHTSQRKSRRQQELQEKVSKLDFHTRMAKDIAARKEKIQHLESTAMALLVAEHSFKPKLNVKDHLIRNRKSGWDSLATPLRRYTEDYKPPDEGRRRKKKKRRRRKPLESPWSTQPK